jgi:hypothetical protein
VDPPGAALSARRRRPGAGKPVHKQSSRPRHEMGARGSGTGSIEAAGFAREGQRLERRAYMSVPPSHTTVGPRALGSGP